MSRGPLGPVDDFLRGEGYVCGLISDCYHYQIVIKNRFTFINFIIRSSNY